jgi:hypothetical protein
MAATSLPLDLDTHAGLQAFLQAIDDPTARAHIATAALPEGAKQLVQMADDPIVQQTAVDLGRRTLAHRHEVSLGRAVPDPAFTKQVETEGAAIRQQLQTKYPEGMALLANYANMQQPSLLAGGYNAGSFAANAYVVANAGIYVNAAAATNVVVAAEAVALIAVVVS